MLNQNEINHLVLLAQENDDNQAINDLWELYFPLLKDIVLFEATKFDINEDDLSDLINDSFCVFREGILKANLKDYCFSQYIRGFVEDKIVSLIRERYLNYL